MVALWSQVCVSDSLSWDGCEVTHSLLSNESDVLRSWVCGKQ